jgi:hypothetical protein
MSGWTIVRYENVSMVTNINYFSLKSTIMIPKLDRIIADNDFRPALSYAYVTEKETCASDAHMMVVHSTPEIFDEEFIPQIPKGGLFIGKEALRDLAQKNVIKVNFIEGHSLIEVIHKNKYGPAFKRYFAVLEAEKAEFKFPDYNQIWPNSDPAGDSVEKIGVNPKLLARLEDGLGGTYGLKLRFYGQTGSIVCTPHESCFHGAKGLIMPIITS